MNRSLFLNDFTSLSNSQIKLTSFLGTTSNTKPITSYDLEGMLWNHLTWVSWSLELRWRERGELLLCKGKASYWNTNCNAVKLKLPETTARFQSCPGKTLNQPFLIAWSHYQAITDKPLSGQCCCAALAILGENLYDVSNGINTLKWYWKYLLKLRQRRVQIKEEANIFNTMKIYFPLYSISKL